MFRLKTSGSFKNTERFFKRMTKGDLFRSLDHYGQKGVDALRANTPVDSGITASSWDYAIIRNRNSYSIAWTNSSKISTGAPIVILLQYGHGTGTGGYVQGQDFINPATKAIFDEIAEEVWKVVTSA